MRAAEPDRTVSEFLDSNGDHRISYDESVHSLAVKAMREMDTYQNSRLTRAEVARQRSKSDAGAPTVEFDGSDADGDGQVSLEELKNGAAREHRK